MATRDLTKYLDEQAGEYLRGVAQYDGESTDIPYLREDVKEDRLISQIDRMLKRLRPESTSAEERSFPFGDLHVTLRVFEEAIIMHFPLGRHRGVVVSLEPETASQLNTFVGGCLERLKN